MIREAAFYIGYAVLVSGGAIAAGAAVLALWWWAVGKLVEHAWTLKLFYETASRILDERREPDRNQLTHWPPSPTGRWPWERLRRRR